MGEAVPQNCGGNEENPNKRPVYNLTVAENHLFYAGGFLVHNCDSATQALAYLLYSSGEVAGLPGPGDDNMVLPALDESYLNSELCYDVYGGA